MFNIMRNGTIFQSSTILYFDQQCVRVSVTHNHQSPQTLIVAIPVGIKRNSGYFFFFLIVIITNDIEYLLMESLVIYKNNILIHLDNAC